MKKFKLLGVLFILFVMFSFVTVNAKTLTLREIVQQAEADNPGVTVTTDPDYNNDEINGNLTISAAGSTLTATYNSSTKEFVFVPAGSTTSSGEDQILGVILTALSKLQGFSLEGGDIKSEMATDASKYTYSKCGLEGTVNSNNKFATLKVNADKFNLNCTNTSSSSSSSSSSSDKATTSIDTNVKNPKTGVFVPVAGLSVLIVASVVCLIWISKKSFKL